MNKDDLIKKLTSRKFFAMLMGFVSMLLITKGMPENQIAQVVSLVGGFGGIITYIFSEAFVDGSRLPEPIKEEKPKL